MIAPVQFSIEARHIVIVLTFHYKYGWWCPVEAYNGGDIAPHLDYLAANWPAPAGSRWQQVRNNTARVVNTENERK